MKLTVIGKYGPYAKSGNHAASCYLVSEGDTNLVMDMGPLSLWLQPSSLCLRGHVALPPSVFPVLSLKDAYCLQGPPG